LAVLLATLVSALAVNTAAAEPPPPPSPPAPPGEPAPIAEQGYSVVFSDDFDTLQGTAFGDRWWDPDPHAGAIFVQDGILHMQSKRSQGYPNLTLSTESAPGLEWTRGYFEARMNWTGGNGAWPAFWLLSSRHIHNGAWPNINPYCAQNGLPAAECYSAELDMFEGQGSEPNVFYGTLHRNSAAGYGQPNTQNANNFNDLSPTRLADNWHTYAALWDSTQIRWYLDDQLVSSTPVYDSTNQPMFMLFDEFIGGWTTGTDASTPDVLDNQVDWVKVWQRRE
jgi:hypothetical protein